MHFVIRRGWHVRMRALINRLRVAVLAMALLGSLGSVVEAQGRGTVVAPLDTLWPPHPDAVLTSVRDRARQNLTAQIVRPRLHVGTLVRQMLLGTGAAWLGGAVAYAVGAGIANDRRVPGDDAYSPAGNWALLFGSVLNGALAVHGVGRAGGVDGSYWAAAAGAALPSLVLLLPRMDECCLVLYGVVSAPVQAASASVAFNLMRRTGPSALQSFRLIPAPSNPRLDPDGRSTSERPRTDWRPRDR